MWSPVFIFIVRAFWADPVSGWRVVFVKFNRKPSWAAVTRYHSSLCFIWHTTSRCAENLFQHRRINSRPKGNSPTAKFWKWSHGSWFKMKQWEMEKRVPMEQWEMEEGVPTEQWEMEWEMEKGVLTEQWEMEEVPTEQWEMEEGVSGKWRRGFQQNSGRWRRRFRWNSGRWRGFWYSRKGIQWRRGAFRKENQRVYSENKLTVTANLQQTCFIPVNIRCIAL